jgi:hypothetical protein
MLTNANVVRNVHQVIQPDTILDDGIIERATVNRRVGANFNIIANQYTTNLRYFHPAFIAAGIAETIRTNYRAVMNNATLPQHSILHKRHVGEQS